jgi:hypothetical protein
MTAGRRVGLAALGALALIAGGSWLLDYRDAGEVHVAVSMRPAVLPADGFTTGVLTVRVTGSGGVPRVGDTVEILDEGLGFFDRTRALTDRNGSARYVYTPQRASVYEPARPVPVLITDTSLGRLIEFDKVSTFTMTIVDPSKLKAQGNGTKG